MRGAGAFLIVCAVAVPLVTANIRKPAAPNTTQRLACVIVPLLLGETDDGTTDQIHAARFGWQIAPTAAGRRRGCRISGSGTARA
jgi:hypothetical protein